MDSPSEKSLKKLVSAADVNSSSPAAAGCAWLAAAQREAPLSIPRRDELKALYEETQNIRAPLPNDKNIEKDIHRTYPHIPLFKSDAFGTDRPRNLLRAYCVLKPDVGYCQGMNFVAGFLMRHMPSDADAFVTFVHMMHSPKWNLACLFRPGLSGLHEAMDELEKLARKHLPLLYAHLESIGLKMTFISQRWLLSIFSTLLGTSPKASPIITKLWDRFFEYGWSALLAFAIELLRQLAPRMLGESFDEIVHVIEDIKKGSEASIRMATRALRRTLGSPVMSERKKS